jgi:dTDP-glucose pyrophosphorylase
MRESGDALVLLLAGGIGSRLNLLVGRRAKPAVPFGGIYRIIDFSLSNVMNSGLTRLGLGSHRPYPRHQDPAAADRGAGFRLVQGDG